MNNYKNTMLILLMVFASCKTAHSKGIETLKVKLEGEKEVVVQDSGRAIFIENPELSIKYTKNDIKNVRLKFNIYRSEIYQATKENKSVFPYTKEDLLKYKPFVPFTCVFVSNEKGNEMFTKIYKSQQDINRFKSSLKNGKIKDFLDLRNYNFSLCKQKSKIK